MTTLTQARPPGSFIVSEANGFRSRERATIAASQNVEVGQLLGTRTATGLSVPLDVDASDGSQTFSGIAVYPAKTPADATARIATLARDAEVREADLTFPPGLDAAERATLLGQLKAAGIILR